MSTEIAKIEELEYQAIIRYIFLRGLKGNQIYKDMLYSLCEQSPSYVTVKIGLQALNEANLVFKMQTDREA